MPILSPNPEYQSTGLILSTTELLSGVAGPLATWCGGQICRPIVLGFGKWTACLKPRVLMPKVTCSIYSILVSIWYTRVCWYNGFLCNHQCSIAVIILQFSPICRPLASAAWCGLYPRTPLAMPLGLLSGGVLLPLRLVCLSHYLQ